MTTRGERLPASRSNTANPAMPPTRMATTGAVASAGVKPRTRSK